MNEAALPDDDDILNNCGPIDIPLPPEPVQALDATGPRLMITKIESENFKSYGGNRTLGPFHKNFTCVVGPNGSGKSNVIDSMLFVFGYRSSKVRSKKLSQLIHNSELVSNPNSCMVSVYFQKIIDHGPGVTEYEVVPNTEFVISRRAYRDNSSTYWINNTRAVYKDVTNLLRKHGVDLDHNRFLILQGEVEQIAMMKPKAPSEHEDGFLEYLEDIIGSSRFKEPLSIYGDRIERLNDLRLEKLTRVKAVEKEKDELEGVRNEAVGYLRLVNQVARMKNILYQQSMAKERAIEEETKVKLETTQAELRKLTGDIKEKSRELAKTEADRDQLVERHTELLQRHRDTKAKFSEFEAEDSRLRDEHAHIKANGRKLSKALQAETNKLEELQRLPGEADSRKQAILKQLKELEETKKQHELAYQETVDNLAKETAPLRIKVETAEAALAPLQAEADELSSKLTLEREQFDLVMAGRRREQERADTARKRAEEAKQKLADREAELSEATRQLTTAPNPSRRQSSQSCGNLVTGLNSALRDLNEVKMKEAQLTKELHELRTKLAESKSTLQADTSRGRVRTALLDAKRSGTLPGIIGRLGDLAAIPQKYDVAISTACSALDHIVTDTMDTAQQAVTFLKQNNLGLATFIVSLLRPVYLKSFCTRFCFSDLLPTSSWRGSLPPLPTTALDKIKKWENKANAVFVTPKGNFVAERLYDLVETVNDSIRPALYFALRDTLVTDNMDAAVQLAFKQRQRYRVVTLQGQLIETSGAMSGGGGRPLSGRMFTSLEQVREFSGAVYAHCGRKSLGKDDAPDLASLEEQLSQGDADLARFRENRSRLEEVVTRLTRQKEEAERTVKRCETECVRLLADVAALTAEAERSQQRARSTGPSDAEQKRFEAELSKLEKTVKQKVDLASKKRMEAESLKAQLLDVGSARLTAVRSRLDAIEKKTKETNDQLTKLQVGVKTAARNFEKSKSKVASIEAELEAAKQKLTDVDAKLKDLEEEARTCMDEFKKIQADVEQLQMCKEEAQSRLAEIEASLAELQKSESSARRAVAQLESELNQASSKARHWQREIRSLRLHRIDDLSDDEDTVTETQTTVIDAASDSQSSQPVPEGVPLNETSINASPVAEKRQKSTVLPTYTLDQLNELSVDCQELRGLEERIAGLAPNMAAIEEFRRKAEIYLTRVGELNHVTALLGEQRKLMEDAKAKRLSEFLDGFHAITAKLKEMYQMITQGGDAELELIDSLDPFSEGIVFSVRPPKKSWKNIANLSGGEKTLSSLALVFALHHYKPTPLYVMDEIDAALDFKNVSIVGNYLKERTKNAQFVVISLRNNMFELADQLVGIYKTHNITKTITLFPGPLCDQLSKVVVRVATAHGREKDLEQMEQRQQLTSAPLAVGVRLVGNQPMVDALQPIPFSQTLSNGVMDGITTEQPIEIE
ncbi:RecF/RecN/SMC protein [Opisthorchis viverrini]|uniref:Structural maintenance of chromosomes protein n=1 Tax=Opisthorchis viverrini TaxID=6198 RepID=A0A1S8WUR7_OPIVI|nr:RecF/RecN/SMC protein [Opisthorchis viverrini]